MSATDNSKDTESLAGLTAVDEILQILYWLRGEGLGTEVSARNLVRFLPMSEEAIEPLLSRMAEARLVVRVASSVDDLARYRLTDQGASEGGRRFADEFADIARPGHGECGDPSCDCHQTGDPADCHHHHGAVP